MILALLACADPEDVDETPADPALDLVAWDGETVTYADGFVPYTLATPLFSDYAAKDRAIRLPDGEVATWADEGVFGFPVGTVIVKSFLFPADLRAPTEDLRIVETRVLTLEEDGWDTWPWLWNEEQTEATRAASGAVIDLEVIGLQGEEVAFSYLVPQRNQCIDCHEVTVADEEGENRPIGPTARNLNHGDQLDRLQGLFDAVPPLEDIPAATDVEALVGVDPTTLDDLTLDAAAHDYLDVNCAHCHNPEGDEGRSSQLFLNWDNTDTHRLGVCKKPGSAGKGTGGLTYDIVPGQPTASILWYRMQTDELGEMMPDIGRSVVDVDGVALIAEWILRLEGTCSEP